MGASSLLILGISLVLSFTLEASVPVFVSEGLNPKVAQTISRRCDKAHAMMGDLLQLEPKLSLYVLSEKDWPNFSEQVFGMPSLNEETHRLTVAGTRGWFWEGFVDLLKVHAAPEAFQQVIEAYQDENGKIDLSSFFDLLVIHELGHSFHLEANIKSFPRPWLQEFYANLVLHSYIALHEPELLPTLLAFPRALNSMPIMTMPKHRLSDFGFPGLDDITPDNYVWYQAQLHLAAERLYDTNGTHCLAYLTQTQYPGSIKTDEDLAAYLSSGPCKTLTKIIQDWPR